MSHEGIFSIVKSNELEGDSNFITWKIWMRIAFISKGIWYVVDKRIQTSAPHQDSSKVVDTTPSMPSDVVKQDKLKVLSMLFNSVKDNVIYHIALKMDPADCCHTFYELYESKNMAQTMYLFDQLQSLRLEELQSMTDYIRCTRELTSQLQDIGETLSKDRIVHTMLNGLPSNYKAFI